INGSVLAFTLAVSGLTSVICGLAPALHSSRLDLATSMREAGRGVAGHSKQALVRNTLVVGQVALCLMLLSGTSPLVRTFVAIQRIDLGVRPDRVLTMRVPLPAQHYPDTSRRNAFYQDLLPRVSAVPGVAAVGLNTGLHPLGNMWTAAEVPGAPPSDEPVVVHQINAGYAEAFALRAAAGRLLTDLDVSSARHVAVINERFARARLNGRPPLGQLVHLPRLKQPPFGLADDAFEVVGVVHDVPNDGLGQPTLPEIYLPFTPLGVANELVIRTDGDAASVTRSVIAQVYAIDRNQPVTAVKTLDALLDEDAYATPRFNLLLLSVFALVGVTLAIVGVYGVMSNAVAQQTHEIGVRLAVGASGSSIARMVIARGSRLLLGGMALGLAGSVVVARLLARQVWNVPAFDPLAIAAVSLMFLVVGLQACFWPARPAAHVDPIVALRQD